jgi:hypothetical protein
MMAKLIDTYLSTLSYLRYEEIMRMPVPLLNALVAVKSESKGNGTDNLGPLINAFLGRR